MIRKYVYGHPYETGAVIHPVTAEEGMLPFFRTEETENGLSFTITLGRDEILFGLGETVRGINKRGYIYRSWNSDICGHNESVSSLYASQNFLLFFSAERLFAIYVDDPGRVTWDLGYTQTDTAVITSENGDLEVYLMEGDSLTGIVSEFRELIGRSYLPPRWAFGYIQSRWGYASEADIRRIVDAHREKHIPLDGICMDIDYMVGYRDFTWNREGFPDLKRFSGELKENHIRLVPIIDAGIMAEENDPLNEEGIREGYFCRKADGSLFQGAVWPGKCYFPDFLKPETRAWFGKQYKGLLDQGVEGFWNDMNEPAIFYTEESLAEAYRIAESYKGKNIGIDASFELKDAFARIQNNPEDYKRFYHQIGDQQVRHDRVHNLYGAMMTRAAGEYFGEYNPEKRYLLFSRSSYVGSHRYGGVWQGDNHSMWSHISMCMKMLPAMNMCGYLYTGCDLGGFGCDTTEDLLERFLQLGVFMPLMRNHSATGTREQEVYRFSIWQDMRDTLTVRYALLPYLYSEYMKAAFNNRMLFRPLAFDYPGDLRAIRVEDQLMWGGDCMIAPVCEQNARGRYVYLPEDMIMLRFRSAQDFDTLSLEKGDHYIDLALNEFPLFIRKGHVMPLGPGGEYSESIREADLKLVGWTGEGAEYALYSDDGQTTRVDPENNITILR